MSATELEELFFEVSPVSLLWEVGSAIRAWDVLLDHGLELTDARVPISDVERDIFWPNHFNEVHDVRVIDNVVLDDRYFEVDRVLTGRLVVRRLYHR